MSGPCRHLSVSPGGSPMQSSSVASHCAPARFREAARGPSAPRRFLPPGLTPVTPSLRLGKAYPALLASLESGLPCPTGGVVLKVLVEDPGTPERGWGLCRHRNPPVSTGTRPEALCIHHLPCWDPTVLGGYRLLA